MKFFCFILCVLFMSGCQEPAKHDFTSKATEESWKKDLEKAEKLYNDRFIDDAEQEFLKVLKSAPRNPKALEYLGNIYFRRGNFAQAGNYYEQSLAQNYSPDIEYNLGVIAESKNDPAAHRIFLNLAEKHGYAPAQKKVEEFLKKEKLFSDTARNEIAALKKDAAEALKMNNLKPAEEFINSALEKFDQLSNVSFASGSDIVSLNSLQFLKARILEEKGSSDAALDIYKRILFDDPAAHDARYRCALVYVKLGMVKRAIEDLKQYCSAVPANTEARGTLATLYYKDGNLDDSLGCLQQIIEKDPQNSAAYYYSALCLRDTGRNQEALEACQKAMKYAPPLSQVYENAQILQKSLRKQP